MNKSILALSVVAGFAAFAPSAQAGWYDSYYSSSSGTYRCYDEDGDRVPCRTYRKVLPSIPGVPGYLQRHVEGVLGVAPNRGCRRWSSWREEWVRVPC